PGSSFSTPTTARAGRRSSGPRQMAGGYVSIGERIAILRRRRGMSQAALAGRLGKSAQWLSNIERGVRRADRHSILVPIASVLRVSVAELTGERPATEVRPELDDTAG